MYYVVKMSLPFKPDVKSNQMVSCGPLECVSVLYRVQCPPTWWGGVLEVRFCPQPGSLQTNTSVHIGKACLHWLQFIELWSSSECRYGCVMYAE